jgi:hypothetical protein
VPQVEQNISGFPSLEPSAAGVAPESSSAWRGWFFNKPDGGHSFFEGFFAVALILFGNASFDVPT